MVSHESLGALGLGVLDEGSDSGPGSQDITTADVDLGTKIVANLAEDPLDRLLVRQRCRSDGRGRVGGASNGVALPGEEEDDAAVRGRGVDQAHLGRAEVTWQDNVDARRGSDDFLALLIVHLSDRVREGTGAVDDALGLDGDVLGRVAILFRDQVLDGGAAESALLVLDQACNFGVVGDGGTVQSGSHGNGDVHARVVVGTVVVDEGANQVGLLEHGEGFQSFALGKKVRALNALASSQEIIELGSRPVVRGLPPPVEGQHDGKPGAQMRGRLKEVFALLEGLSHELVLVVVEVEDSLLQVAHTSVDKLGALTAGAAAEVVTLHNGDLEAAGGSVQGNSGAGGTAANDEHVVLSAIRLGAEAQAGKLLLARLDPREAWQFEGAVSAVGRRGHGG